MWIDLFPFNPKRDKPLNDRLGRYLDTGVEGISLIYGGVRAGSYGVIVTNVQIWDKPKRIVISETIPGRNGTLYLQDKVWENIQIKFTMAIVADFQRRFDAFLSAIMPLTGYQEIWTSVDPEYFRLGQLMEGIQPHMIQKNRVGTFELIFDCKPQRFLAGHNKHRFTDPTKAVLYNQYSYEARPLIKVCSSTMQSGQLAIGDCAVQIQNTGGRDIYIDSEEMNSYQIINGTKHSCNRSVWCWDYPLLKAGYNKISWTGFDAVEIEPRWWIL